MQQINAGVNRLQFLKRVLTAAPKHNGAATVKSFLSTDGQRISIGDVSKIIKQPKNPELVPRGYLPKDLNQWQLRHLKWLLQKDLMGQDVFLIGGPGPVRRHLAMAYLELTKQEAEYVTLTRDTTEADLKQRREIKDGSSYYHDQAAVRAALNGRVLVLDGIEKAERNVLPVLNNLLENREMNLDDGRRLIPHSRFDALTKESEGDISKALQVLRVSSRFRVLALGLPCPPHQGQPLDPPLRSRFQAREISHPPYQEHMEELLSLYPSVSRDTLTRCLSVCHALLAEESKGLSLPDYPQHLLKAVMGVLQTFPSATPESVLPLAYPHSTLLTEEAQTPVKDVLQTFDLLQPDTRDGYYPPTEITVSPVTAETVNLTVAVTGSEVTVEVPGGPHLPPLPPTSSPLPYGSQLLSTLLQLHATGHDAAIVGPRGCGKSSIVAEMGRLLGYQVEPILLYQDMTSRELTQQRGTDASGNTVWLQTPLLQAALAGKLAVLDGLQRLHGNTLAAMQRLIQDREMQLYDGSRLLRHDRYDSIQQEHGYTTQDMRDHGLLRVHPSFRMVCLAEPPQHGVATGQWMRAEALSLMPWVEMRAPTEQEMRTIVNASLPPSASPSSLSPISKLVDLSCSLSAEKGGTLSSLTQSLSLRQVLRISRRLASFPGDLHALVQDACLARFLPPLVKQSLDEALEKHQIVPTGGKSEGGEPLVCSVDGDNVTIGHTTVPRYQPESTSKVPETLFFDIQQHVEVLEKLLQDYQLGEHLLLIGNQGVGKNKLADRFLQLLNRPREYLQLHRDSTVQSLTVQPCVSEGRLSHMDSPLVVAVKEGSVLLLDEADKAPTHVTCVLKTLVEAGEMLLSDGRRIVPPTHPLAAQASDDVIVSHPDFRMIVLANRPGFPFLGNDFFAVLGDLFSCHAIHNPLAASEVSLLQSYGPSVPAPTLHKLVRAFSELRELADEGRLQYPYSTREVVAVVKHLEKFPADGVSLALRNVLDFDSWSTEAKAMVGEVMERQGLPIDSTGSTQLATKISLGAPAYIGRWRQFEEEELNVESESLRYKGPLYLPTSRTEISAVDARGTIFSEQHSYYHLPLSDSSLISDISTSAFNFEDTNPHPKMSDGELPVRSTKRKSPVIHVASVAPLTLHTLLPSDSMTRPLLSLSLHGALPTLGTSHQPRLRLWKGTPDRGMVGLYEELTNTVMLADPLTGEVLTLDKSSFVEKLTLPLRQLTQQRVDNRMALSGESIMIFTKGEDAVNVIDQTEGKLKSFSVGFDVNDVNGDGKGGWIVSGKEANLWISPCLTKTVELDFDHNILSKRTSESSFVGAFDSSIIRAALGDQSEDSSAKDGIVTSGENHHALILPNFPDSESGAVYGWPRQMGREDVSNQLHNNANRVYEDRRRDIENRKASAVLPSTGQIVRVINRLPANAPHILKTVPASSYLEVTDIVTRVVSYLPIPPVSGTTTEYWQWAVGRIAPSLMVCAGDDTLGGSLVTVDRAGGVRVWEVGGEALQEGASEWSTMLGQGENERLELKRDSGDFSLDMPKHGKIDAENAPHVGGNTWAGGTGGRDTAGLGGVGGPYRLDAGHDVHQVSDEVKAAVPKEVSEAARKMARAAYQERLKSIKMSEYDATQYDEFSKSVVTQVTQMRNVLNSLTAKAGERWWVRRRPDGDLDDNALVDGIAGATNIYRQRREVPPEAGQPQMKPKRLRLLLDASGSMYRFNGHDNRLQRSLEAALMLMESTAGHEARLVYDVYAHSGEDYAVELSTLDKVPDNDKKRLVLLKSVLAHSQFCMSGDSTIQATHHAMSQLSKEADDYDQSFVILLSDANLDRYNISPERLALAMTSTEGVGTDRVSSGSVQCYAVFIGSLGNQAKRLASSLPAGRAYVCLDADQLPQVMQQIFTHAMTQ